MAETNEAARPNSTLQETNIAYIQKQEVEATQSESSEQRYKNEAGCLFSVITIVYNDCESFDMTAKSVLEQTDADFEWIIIDGGSTDGTAEAAARVGSRAAFCCSERDGGIYDAMNKGLRHATGEFVVFMNAGDIFADRLALAKVGDALYRSNRDVAMVVCSAEFRLSATRSYIQRPRKIDKYIAHSLPTSHQAIFVRTALHRDAMFNTGFKVAADYDALCRIYRMRQQTIYIDDVIASVWRGLDSNSLRFPMRNVLEMAKTQRQVLGLGRMYIFASAVRRLMPAVAFRLMCYRWSAPLTYRLIRMLRPR